MQSCPSPFGGFSRWRRIGLLLGGLALCGILAVAASLTPDRQGLGTHQQLGLPPCSFRQVFGMRCPACGMTTAWAHFVRGEWRSAMSCSVAGTLLALIGTLAAPWAIAAAIRGHWVIVRPTETLLLGICLSFLAIALTDWLVRLVLEHFSRS